MSEWPALGPHCAAESSPQPQYPMFLSRMVLSCGLVLSLHPLTPLSGRAAEATVATAVYARVGNGYERVQRRDGSFKPEYYALSNGGRIYGTTSDLTVDRVTYPQVAEIAMRLLAQQNYRYAQRKEQAKLLIVLQWGNTIGYDRSSYGLSVNAAASAYAELVASIGPQGPGRGFAGAQTTNTDGSPIGSGDPGAAAAFETAMLRLLMDNR